MPSSEVRKPLGRALIVGKATRCRDRAANWLRSADWSVDLTSTTKEAGGVIQSAKSPVLLVLFFDDRVGQGEERFDIDKLSWNGARTALLIVCPGGRRNDVVDLLDAGADDVIVGALTRRELLARARAVMRRVARGRDAFPPPLRGVIAIDNYRRTVAIDQVPIPLTASEFDVFAYLAEHPDRGVAPWDIIESVFGTAHHPDTALVRVHIFGLRRKLVGTDVEIQTVRGRGYRLVASDRRPLTMGTAEEEDDRPPRSS